MVNPFKLGSGAREWDAHAYKNEWYHDETSDSNSRLVIGASSNQIELITSLMDLLPEPFGILYVLIVSRLGHKDGRYQSLTPTSRNETCAFLNEYKDYFESDARHAIWILSLPVDAMLIYEQHNLIYGYRMPETVLGLLADKGFMKREFSIPDPHCHNYNEEFDSCEDAIFSKYEWKYFPLVEEVDDP
jgi:hypothetical protein